MSKERPILFSGEMVRAILDGRKTQTRRVIKPQPSEMSAKNYYLGDWVAKSPYGKPGDRLWVRETFWQKISKPSGAPDSEGDIYDEADYPALPNCECPPALVYQQTMKKHDGKPMPGEWWLSPPSGWDGESEYYNSGEWVFLPWDSIKRPSIHMPRWASRITLEITNVRVERLLDITTEDALAEGIEYLGDDPVEPVMRFGALWSSIYGLESWQSNPWVWVIEFKRIDKR